MVPDLAADRQTEPAQVDEAVTADEITHYGCGDRVDLGLVEAFHSQNSGAGRAGFVSDLWFSSPARQASHLAMVRRDNVQSTHFGLSADQGGG